MRKLVLFMHVSLDGFVAGPNGEMDWINVDEELFDYAGQRTNEADTALYGRVTFEMMDSYWPTAADQPNASRHDIQHSKWYNEVTKVVVSKTLAGKDLPKTFIIGDNIPVEIDGIKSQPGREIVIFGSPGTSHSLMAENLIDSFWLFVNPVLLGKGIPMFKDIKDRANLKLVSSNTLKSGVVCLNYELIR